MCGRYVSTKSTADLLAEFDAVDETSEQTPASWNVAPTQRVRTVVNRPMHGAPEGERTPVRQLRVARWGLVPSWAKDLSVGNRMFNARAESLPEKSAFKRAFAKRRCLVPADGWYEWVRTSDDAGKPMKQPFFMTPPDDSSVAFAGLYEFWRAPDADADSDLLLSVTIVTVPSQGELSEIHGRMPLVLAEQDWTRWLAPELDGPVELLAPVDEAARDALEMRPVSPDVNTVQNDSAALVERIELTTPLELF
jgi:putative SOS response-associated peptidase YedK